MLSVDCISGSDLSNDCGYRILRAIRRIIRAVDLHSRELHQRFQITTPQMLCLSVVSLNRGITLSQLADSVSLCTSTVSGIVDRLERRGLIRRRRASNDRRRVALQITMAGHRLIEAAPPLLQNKFTEQLKALSELERNTITQSLEQIVGMMGAGRIATSPHLMTNLEEPAAQETAVAKRREGNYDEIKQPTGYSQEKTGTS